MESKGDLNNFSSCAGDDFANRNLTDDEQAILNCATTADADASEFAACASGSLLARGQKAVLDCAVSADSALSFAECAAPNVGIHLSDEQRILARCAMESNGDTSNFASCAGAAFLGRSLGTNEQAVLNCAASSNGDVSTFASCSATRLLGDNLSRE
jgi:hypothetical protein